MAREITTNARNTPAAFRQDLTLVLLQGLPSFLLTGTMALLGRGVAP
ncbi:hypothetical protein IP90_03227 [Luteimonas cucumeris]|uniref:Uncharacterized protein n=1 Tax=Luteimonas cucumeris TaxID=985012 RepID=A0A562KUF5_9GAMM|nr:hypothetical protein [Luteimonas cucumeris]TWH99048.1 hypothetical protein IP90_03227 [Luteimonas cucumeris]